VGGDFLGTGSRYKNPRLAGFITEFCLFCERLAPQLTHEVIYQSIWASEADHISGSRTSYLEKINVQTHLDEFFDALDFLQIARP
jgi:hypothetical protein